MNLYIFATVHSLMNNTKFDWQLSSSRARAICFELWIHFRDVTLVLWLTASHTGVSRAKQASCLLHWLSVFTLLVSSCRSSCINQIFTYSFSHNTIGHMPSSQTISYSKSKWIHLRKTCQFSSTYVSMQISSHIGTINTQLSLLNVFVLFEWLTHDRYFAQTVNFK